MTERKHLAARHKIERLEHLGARDITAAEQVLLLVEHVGGQRLERLAGAAERDQPAALAERPGAGLQRLGRRDVVDHHVDTLPFRQFQKLLGDVALASHRPCRRHRPCDRPRTCRLDVDRDHSRPRPFRHHHLVDAEPATGAEHRHGLAGLHPGPAQHLVGCRERIGDDADFRGMLLMVQARRQPDEVLRRQLDVLRIAAIAFAGRPGRRCSRTAAPGSAGTNGNDRN